ncbi:TPA: DUF551 domain-containing protein [Escherichia coli]|nr:DUF551 domain-containing protein [Escherichia coli]HBE6884804.1 DUF551 domain-containing protein [Escherichia coli]
MTTVNNKKCYPSEKYLNELITNIEFAARAPVEVVRAIAAELQKHRKAYANTAASKDGWISCSERMPDKLIPVIVMYEDGEMWSAMWNGNRWDDGTEYPDPHSVTHWREMPAAPQQEVNRG